MHPTITPMPVAITGDGRFHPYRMHRPECPHTGHVPAALCAPLTVVRALPASCCQPPETDVQHALTEARDRYTAGQVNDLPCQADA